MKTIIDAVNELRGDLAILAKMDNTGDFHLVYSKKFGFERLLG